VRRRGMSDGEAAGEVWKVEGEGVGEEEDGGVLS